MVSQEQLNQMNKQLNLKPQPPKIQTQQQLSQSSYFVSIVTTLPVLPVTLCANTLVAQSQLPYLSNLEINAAFPIDSVLNTISDTELSEFTNVVRTN